MPATIVRNNEVRAMKSALNFEGVTKIIASSTDPTAVAVDAPLGSLLLNQLNGLTYRKLDNGSTTNWVQLGTGGASGINYIENGTFDANITGWNEYRESTTASCVGATDVFTATAHGLTNNDIISFYDTNAGAALNTLYYVINAAANTFELSATKGGSKITTFTDAASTVFGRNKPITGTGGTVSGFGDGRVTSGALRGTGSYQLSKGASGTMGQGVAYDFTIAEADATNVLSIGFTYQITRSTLQVNDFDVYVYDVTNSRLIQPAAYTFSGGLNAGPFQFSGQFQATGSLSYRLIFHCASATTRDWIVLVDDVVVGPVLRASAAPVTPWQSFTPSGTWVSNTTYTGLYRRVGSEVEVRLQLALTGAPTATNLSVNMPPGLAIDTARLVATTANSTVGTVTLLDTGTAQYLAARVEYATTTTLNIVQGSVSGTAIVAGAITATSPFTFASGDLINIEFRVPVVGWDANTVMSQAGDLRVVAARAQEPSGQIIANSTATKVAYTQVAFDTHAAWSTANNNYTAPLSGIYRISANVEFPASATGFRQLLFSVNSAVSYILGQIGANSGTASTNVGGSGLIQLNAGDVVEITVLQNSGGPLTVNASGPVFNNVCIERLEGPQTVAASEQIRCRGFRTTNQSIPTNGAVIVYTSKTYDTHAALNTATGVFTAPRSGYYHVYATLPLFEVESWSASSDVEIRFRVNGVVVARPMIYRVASARTDRLGVFNGADTVLLNAGDQLDVFAFHALVGTRDLTGNSEMLFVTISG